MNYLLSLVESLDKKESRYVRSMLSQSDEGRERLDYRLLTEILKDTENYDEEKVFTKLYKDKNKNAFYRLKNRLMEDIGKHLLYFQHNNDKYLPYNLYLLASIFSDKNNYDLAEYFLSRAEKEALQTENINILDAIYSEQIRVRNETLSGNPEPLVEKRRANAKKLDAIRQIDDLLAVISYQMKLSQNLTKRDRNVTDMLAETIRKFELEKEVENSPTVKLKIFQSVSKILIANHDFKTLENYSISTFKQFIKKQYFNRNNHDSKLQMLSYIVNSLSRNRKIKESLEYLKVFEKSIEEYDRLYYQKYVLFYHINMVYNYSIINPNKAIEILEELKATKTERRQSFYDIFIDLNLAIRWFTKDEPKKAIKFLNQLYIQKGYLDTADELKLKINLFELVIRFELNDHKFLRYRIDQVRKEFRKLLQSNNFDFESGFIEIIEELSYSPYLTRNPKLRTKVQGFINSYKDNEEVNELINITGWLKNKL